MLNGEAFSTVSSIAVLIIIIIITVGTSSTEADWTDCSANCLCKWISGKKNALCRNAGYTSIPTDLNSEIQVLDLSGNNIADIPKEAFKKSGLLNLQKIFVKNSGLRRMDDEAFVELTILVEVDLSNNFLNVLPTGTFTGNERLKVVTMNENPLSELGSSVFPYLPHLKNLEFQNCRIRYVHENAFSNTPALESILLNGNQISHITRTVFARTPHLKTLALDANLWTCDCRLRDFRNWLLRSKLYSRSLVCRQPRTFDGKRWEDIDPIEFACEPSLSLSDIAIQGEPDGNVTLKCYANGDPEPEISWFFNGLPINDDGNDTRYLLTEDTYTNGSKTSYLSIYRVNETDAGDYTCRGRNLKGRSSIGVSLIIPKDPVATTMKRTESWFRYTTFVTLAGAVIVLVSCTILLLTLVRYYLRKRRNGERSKKYRNSKIKSRRKLDASVITNATNTINTTDTTNTTSTTTNTTPDRQTDDHNCRYEGGLYDMELMEQSVQNVIPFELREHPPPVHITIESTTTNNNNNNNNNSNNNYNFNNNKDRSIAVFPPPSASSPAEFNTVGGILPPVGTYGNIFISVSVGGRDDVNHIRTGIDDRYKRYDRRYPDLLDVSRTKVNTGVGTTSDPPITIDNNTLPVIGKTGSSVVTTVDGVLEPDDDRKENRHYYYCYDNTGPRITADGSISVCSLPDAVSNEDIPTPPPPPLCSPLNIDYVSL